LDINKHVAFVWITVDAHFKAWPNKAMPASHNVGHVPDPEKYELKKF